MIVPTVLELIEQGQEKGFALESNEGENKDGEKEYDEKQLFIEGAILFINKLETFEPLQEKSRSLNYQPIDFEIILPPPKSFLI